MKSALVVVSHYNAWKTDHLIALLDQIATIPAGHPFRCRVVVNQAEPKSLELPARHADVEIFYRENTGFNIGAWDLGWRQDPPADYYLFLQEECQIVQPNWLRAFIRLLEKPKVGLVGESHFWSGYSWSRADYYWRNMRMRQDPENEERLPLMTVIRTMMRSRQIPLGKDVGHLQSLILATRREVLEAIDGFMIGGKYSEAIGAEVAVSKQVEALGLQARQLGVRPFRFILHPQWRHLTVGVWPIVFRRLEPYLPIRVGEYFHIYPRWHSRVIRQAKSYVLDTLVSRSKSTKL